MHAVVPLTAISKHYPCKAGWVHSAPGELAMESRCKSSRVKVERTTLFPESCVSGRKGRGEALTGVLVGEVWSCEISPFRVPTLLWKRKATLRRAPPRVRREPCAVRAPRHASTSIARDLGGPRVARQGRVRKAKAVRSPCTTRGSQTTV